MKVEQVHLAAYKAETANLPQEMRSYLQQLRELNQRQDEAEAALEALVQQSAADVQRAQLPAQGRTSHKKGAAAAAAAASAAAGCGSATKAGVAAFEAARARVAEAADEVARIAEQKLKLAQRMYDHVDARIIALQGSNAAFQQEMFMEQARLGIEYGKTAREELGLASSTEAKDKVKALMRKKSYKTAEVLVVPGEGAILADQREPTYCYCNRVSFGEMIACDNPECPIEWFHYDCVGLPHGFEADHWLCKECAAAAAGGAAAAAAAPGAASAPGGDPAAAGAPGAAGPDGGGGGGGAAPMAAESGGGGGVAGGMM